MLGFCFLILSFLGSLSSSHANCPYYDFTIGDFDATVLSDILGNNLLEWDPTAIFPQVHSDAESHARRSNFMSTTHAFSYYNVLFIDTAEKKVLFDCGNGPYSVPQSGKLLETMQEAGIDPSEIDALVFTHGHFDHLGGALKPDGSYAFPNAKYYISRIEHEFWMGAEIKDLSKDLDTEVNEILFKVAKDTLEAISEKLVLFELGEEVIPGVRSRAATGHTPGHSTFIIESGDSRLLHAGDSLVWDIYSVEQPEWKMVLDQDQDAAVQSRYDLLDELADSGMMVFSYHNDFPGLGHVSRSGQGYRYRPAPYEF